MIRELATCLRLIAATVVVCGFAYPLAILAVAAIAAPEQRMGSLIYDAGGRVVGSRLIAQPFARPEYFWPRPSAVDYNAAAAGGSNLSPKNPLVRQRAQQLLERLNLATDHLVPADLVTTSGSGLDPHISLSAAQLQTARVAKARGIGENELQSLVNQQAESSRAPLSSEPLVNVLELNLALDREFPRR